MNRKETEKTNHSMSRKDFLKVTGLGALGVFITSKLGPQPIIAEAAESTASIIKSGSAPSDTTALWLNTGSSTIGKVAPGVLAYYNGSAWVPTVATWT